MAIENMPEDKPVMEIQIRRILHNFDEYLAVMQSDGYVRSARAVMLWSAIPLFYIWGGLHVQVSGTAALLGVAVTGITHGKFLVFLLIMNLYYAIKFAFCVVKLFSAYNPIRIFQHIRRYKKGVRKDASNDDKKFHDYEKIELYRLWARPAVLRPMNEKYSKVAEEMKKESYVRNFLVRLPVIGFLENFLGGLVLPVGLCVAALTCLGVKLLPLIMS